MESILEPILHSPLLPDYVAQLTNYLKLENEKRLAFYEWLDEDTKAEFIEGEIVIHSPARDIHIVAIDNLGDQLKHYIIKNNLGKLRKEQALVKLKRSDFMPDISFFKNDKANLIDDETKIFPVPDFAVEVLSRSTEKYDRKIKFEEYALNGVAEYWMIDTVKKKVEQYILFGTSYKLKKKYGIDESIECYVVNGLIIDVESIFDEQLSQQAVIKILKS